jgi:hypothetical protein
LSPSLQQESPTLPALWRAIGAGVPFTPGRVLDDAEIDWAIETGMAPLLYSLSRDTPECIPAGRRARLQAAERWGRLRSADSIEATARILEGAADRAAPLTLLKGLSVCGEYYSSPHLRFLGDLDLLVDPDDAIRVSAVLAELGYETPREARPRDYRDHHHLPPVRHPDTGIWVELHTRLLPSSLGAGPDGPFSDPVISRERRPSSFEGLPVFRLSPELQLVYTASHWAMDFMPAAGARALLDATLMLSSDSHPLDWPHLTSWLEDRRVAAHLQLMLGYLEWRRLVTLPPGLGSPGGRIAALSPAALSVLVTMVDRYQIQGAMRNVPAIVATGRETTGTPRSRLRTVRAALASGNLPGLLPVFDRFCWRQLLARPDSPRRHILVAASRLLPAGDPQRLQPGRAARTLGGMLAGRASRQ